MAAFTHVDYDREMAFIATRPLTSGDNETLGVVRAATRPDNSSAEFAIIVRGDLKGFGLGKALLVTVVYERLTPPGWKVQVGQRALKDKFATLEDAQKVAMAFAEKVAAAIRVDLDALKGQG